jgi:3-methyladenine DNA glycosylase AlkD
VSLPVPVTAEALVATLVELRSDDAAGGMARYFKSAPGEYGEGDVFLGVTVPTMRAAVRPYLDLPPVELETLLDNPWHEVRAAALEIMARQASRARTPVERRRELFDLYLRRHDRIANWDLVDRAARDVVGRWVVEHPDDTLDRLAASPVLWERRTAIVATAAYLRIGDVDETFRIAEVLVDDRHDLIHKAVGWLVRSAGDVEPARLLVFLDAHAATMPRTMLRYALEHLEPGVRAHYLALGR